ncbi:MAG: site-2 protease family protein [Candidatus Accumulibacter sp.]|jgi:Zn-dependent protease|nr:site-2 protease family protein [Accumulibacter sp.]
MDSEFFRTLFALIRTLAVGALPVILAITLHEAAHGYAALRFGDKTAWVAGRISLNPLRHVDPVGTLLVPALILAASYFTTGSAMIFGWAKPVPVNFGRLKNPKRDMLWVAAAGPAVNLAMAVAWTALLKLMTLTAPAGALALTFVQMCLDGIIVNLVLMTLNLLPLPPLDGGRIAVSLLPWRLALPFSRLERWGFPILLLLLFVRPGHGAPSILGSILSPIVGGLEQFLFNLFQIT